MTTRSTIQFHPDAMARQKMLANAQSHQSESQDTVELPSDAPESVLVVADEPIEVSDDSPTA